MDVLCLLFPSLRFLQGYANGVDPLQLLTFQITLSIRSCHVAAFCKADFECPERRAPMPISGNDRCFILCWIQSVVIVDSIAVIIPIHAGKLNLSGNYV